MTSISSLPSEIAADICARSSIATLSTLCLTSLYFQAEARRILYRNVKLCHPQNVIAWCNAVTGKHQLALYLQSLTLILPVLHCLGPQGQDKVGCALRAVCNLQDLEILYSGTEDSHFHWWPQCNAHILDNCTFRLRRFKNFFFSYSCLEQFISSQKGIQVLSLGGETFSPKPPPIIPDVNSLEIDTRIMNKLDRPRSVKNLRLTMLRLVLDEERTALESLADFAHSLTSLSINRQSYSALESLTTLEAVKIVAAQLPRLKYLSLREKYIRRDDPTELLSALQKLKHLEMLVLDVATVCRCTAGMFPDNVQVGGISHHACDIAAESIMEKSPALQRVVFSNFSDHSEDWFYSKSAQGLVFYRGILHRDSWIYG